MTPAEQSVFDACCDVQAAYVRHQAARDAAHKADDDLVEHRRKLATALESAGSPKGTAGMIFVDSGIVTRIDEDGLGYATSLMHKIVQ